MKPAVKGERLTIEKVLSEQRFNPAAFEIYRGRACQGTGRKGIGRPSTYAAIINTLSVRGYVDRGEEDKN